MPISTQVMSTSALVGTALSVALTPRPGAASVQQGAELLKAFPGARFTNWAINADPCGESQSTWQGVGCRGSGTNANQVVAIQLITNGTTQPSNIPVDFGELPESVSILELQGPVFTESTTKCRGLPNLTVFQLINTTNFAAQCSWNHLPSTIDVLTLQFPGVQFEPSVPWSSFDKILHLELVGMGLTGTVDMAPLCRVNSVLLSGNNFTHINWAPNCDCNGNTGECMLTLDVSQNALDQRMTAGNLPPYIAAFGGSLRLNDNPMLQGALDATEMPPGILRVISDANEADYVDFQNTGLCFTGMHSASVATNLTQAQEEWFAARSCPTVAPPASTHTAAVIAGSVVGSVALLALIGAGVAYGIMRKKRAVRRGSVTTEDEESLAAEYEMKESMN